MQTIKLCLQVGEDGILHLDIPVDVKSSELEVTVTIEPVKKQIDSFKESELKRLEWHDFIEKTFGCLADDPIVRYPQGEYEERETIE